MISSADKKRIGIYLIFSFGLAWLVSLVIYLNGGLQNSPIVIAPLNLTLAGLLIASSVMVSPALANLLTRLITHEERSNLMLRPGLNQKSGLWWLLAWVLPTLGTVLGALLFFALFPQYYDPTLSVLSSAAASAANGQNATAFSPWVLLIISALQGMFLSPFLNGIFTFGEEFGWRAYLLPKLLPLGERKAVLLSGVIWGVWHWPLIAMGHNYGIDYFGYPWLGMGMMVVFCIALGTMLSWLTLKEGSVWPAVIGHAGINGMAALGVYALKGSPNPLLGPTPAGIIGGAFFILLAGALLLLPGALSAGKPKAHWVSQPIESAAPTEERSA